MSTPQVYLEHANVRVPSIPNTHHFLAAAFPDFHERGHGYSETYGYWSHFGNDHTYLALLQADEPGTETDAEIPPYRYEETFRLMHLGFVTNELDEIVARLERHGYQPDSIHLEHPHRRRFYFLDRNQFEWEFIEYNSDDPALRNDYSL